MKILDKTKKAIENNAIRILYYGIGFVAGICAGVVLGTNIDRH